MQLDEYQKQATKTASYPNKGNNLIYPVLGLVGEAGEVAEKVKKLWRNYGIDSGREVDEIDKKELAKELGDVLWYIAATCNELKISMNDVATMNYAKLQDRLQRNVIKSQGDNR